MVLIPCQLSDCRFIKTVEKRPLEPEWTTRNNYPYQEAIEEQTYGVATGFARIVVVDCDKKYIQDKLLEIEQFRNTFTVQTAGKKLNHFYFKVDIDNPKSFSLDDKNKERVIDLQAKGKMVVGPNSVLSTQNAYTIINDSEIQNIPYAFLKSILLNIDENIKVFEREDKSDAQPAFFEFDDIIVKIKNKVSIKDVLVQHGIDAIEGNTCMCPLGHTSEGGKCFSFTKNVWYCFHCYQTGNVFHLMQKLNGIEFIDAKRQLAELAGLENDTKTSILINYADKKKRHRAAETLATEFIKFYHARTIRDDKETEIYIYKEGIYVPEGKTYVLEYIRNILGPLYDLNFAKKVLDKITVDSFVEREQFFIDEDVNLLPVQNGVLNMSTMELLDFKSEYRFFNKLPVFYDPLIQPEKTLQFVKDIVETQSEVDTIQEIAGYLLYRDALMEKAFMFLGGGRNGKTKLITLFTKMLGEQNTTNVSLTEIEEGNFSIINLHNKYANFSPDINSQALEFTGKFKNIVGRDVLNGDRKFKTPILFRPYAKMIFATNDLPVTKDTTDGFWDRWIMVDFPYKFVEDEPVGPWQKKIDKEIIDRITTDKEMSGFLNWALVGLHRLMQSKKFTIHQNTNTIRRKWEAASNTFARFWYSEIDQTGNMEDTIQRDNLMDAYDEYCSQHSLEKESNATIYHFLSNNPSITYKRITLPTNDKMYVAKKVKFKNPQKLKPQEIEITFT
jgi:P4 family phage/plasmid primase-like protien